MTTASKAKAWAVSLIESEVESEVVGSVDVLGSADEYVETLTPEEVEELGFLYLVGLISEARREHRREVESRSTDRSHLPYRDRTWREKATAPSTWSASDWKDFEKTPDDDKDKRRANGYQRNTEEFREEQNRQLGVMVESFVESLRTEWTQELMRTSFGLPDGTITTWGEATVEQHQERVEMFSRQAMTGIEGAARHRQAIQEIESQGAATLIEAVGVPA